MPVREEEFTELFVGCPYCKVGHSKAFVRYVGDDASELMDAKGHYQCDTCGRWFRLKIRMRVLGVPIEQPGRGLFQGDMLRRMLEGG